MALNKKVQSLIEVEIIVILTRFAGAVRFTNSADDISEATNDALRQIKELYDG